VRTSRKTGCCRHKRQDHSHYCNSSFYHAAIPAELPLDVNTNSSGQGQTLNAQRPTPNVQFRSRSFVLVIELRFKLSFFCLKPKTYSPTDESAVAEDLKLTYFSISGFPRFSILPSIKH